MTYSRIAALTWPFLTFGLAGFIWIEWTRPGDPLSEPRADITDGASRSVQEVFDEIYKDAKWGTNAANVGHSGYGSSMESTRLYRAFLQAFLKNNDIHSVVDAGCGDWEFSRSLDWTGIDYRGYDIVASVIDENNRRYGQPNVHFFTANVVEADLPKADLLISKHVLQHLPNADVATFLKQLPKYRHVLLVNGVDPVGLTARNSDIHAGEYRDLDPTQPPFSVPGAKVLTYWDGYTMHQVVYVPGAPVEDGR